MRERNSKTKSEESESNFDKNEYYLSQLDLSEYKFDVKNVPGFKKPVIVYTCMMKECGKEFLRTWNLLDHVRMHQDIKPYSCEICGKEFTQKGNMRKHLKTHSQPSVESRKRYI